MARIDTSFRRLFLFAAPVALLVAACGGAGEPGGDPVDDPANVASVEGSEGVDPGWGSAEAEALKPAAAPATPSDDQVETTSAALSASTHAYTIYAEAKREFDSLDAPKSYYSHTTYVNESTGVRDVDCSGYLDYALKRVLPSSLSLVPTSDVRPVAADWYHYLHGRSTTASTGWGRVLRVEDLRSGDVGAWLPASGTSSTGHVMIVRGTPTKSSRSGEWLVPVYDSAVSAHASDSRGTSYTGIGKGVMGLVVDSNGAPTKYYWRGGESTTAFATSIALGRLE